jgi:Short C-terminal domain
LEALALEFADIPDDGERRVARTYEAIRQDYESTFGIGSSSFSFLTCGLGDVLKAQAQRESRWVRPLASFASAVQSGYVDKFVLVQTGVSERVTLHSLVCCAETFVSQPKPSFLARKVSGQGEEEGYTTDTNHQYFHYPHSPVSNFAVAIIKGKRAYGEFVMTQASGLFIANPELSYTRTMLESLNNLDFAPGGKSAAHTIADAARLMFSQDRDFFQDDKISGWHFRNRGDASGFQGRWGHLGARREVFFDEFFLPTLIETETFNFETWKTYPAQKKPSSMWRQRSFSEYKKMKYFFIGLSPYRDSTLVMMNYPCMTKFGQDSGVESVDLQLGWYKWILSQIEALLSADENIVLPSVEHLKTTHRYWAFVNQTRKDETTHRKSMPNLEVANFERALREIESPGLGAKEATAGPTKSNKPEKSEESLLSGTAITEEPRAEKGSESQLHSEDQASVEVELRRLKELFQSGAISRSQYDEQRKKILMEMI